MKHKIDITEISKKIHYRYQDEYYMDDWNSSTEIILKLYEFVPIKETPSGYWIMPKYEFDRCISLGKDFDYYGKHRFILKKSTKRFAYPTKDEALNNFIHRKKSQLQILESQRKKAKKTLEIAKVQNPKIYKKAIATRKVIF